MIKLIDLTKEYNAEGVRTLALNKVALEIDEGEMVAVVGTSGSGKTTLLNIIGAMDVPTSGSYLFNDTDVTKLSSKGLEDFRRENISFVFQQFELMTAYTVYENVEMPLIARSVKKHERKQIIEKCLAQLGIEDLSKKLACHISGGQQQRVAIARALAAGTKVILADEPTGALDSTNSEVLMSLLRQINETGKTVIVVTHDMDLAQKCGRVVRILDGAVTG